MNVVVAVVSLARLGDGVLMMPRPGDGFLIVSLIL